MQLHEQASQTDNFIQRVPNEILQSRFQLFEVIFRLVTYLVAFLNVLRNELVTLFIQKRNSTQQQYLV